MFVYAMYCILHHRKASPLQVKKPTLPTSSALSGKCQQFSTRVSLSMLRTSLPLQCQHQICTRRRCIEQGECYNTARHNPQVASNSGYSVALGLLKSKLSSLQFGKHVSHFSNVFMLRIHGCCVSLISKQFDGS